MNGRVARELRKACKFNPRDKREYHTITFTAIKHILRYDPASGEVEHVERPVDSFTTECVTASRKVYQYMKRKYVNPNHEESFNVLPEESEIQKIQDQYVTEQHELQTKSEELSDEPSSSLPQNQE